MAVVLLQSEEEIDAVVVGEADKTLLDGANGTTDDVVVFGLGDGVGVGAHIAEVVAGDEERPWSSRPE